MSDAWPDWERLTRERDAALVAQAQAVLVARNLRQPGGDDQDISDRFAMALGRHRDLDWCCWCHVDTNAGNAECTFSETGFYCKENETDDR
jgi:hypothetical protein